MSWYVIAGAALLCAPLVVGSLTVCAPKWWRERVSPWVPEPVRRANEAVSDRLTGSWVERVLQVIVLTPPVLVLAAFAAIIWPAGVVILALADYTAACLAWVERRCPYAAPGDTEWRAQHEGTRKNLTEWSAAPWRAAEHAYDDIRRRFQPAAGD